MSTEAEFSWLRPGGPFTRPRYWLLRLIILILVGFFVGGFVIGSTGGSLAPILAGSVVMGPALSFLVVVYLGMWVLDIILAYLKH